MKRKEKALWGINLLALSILLLMPMAIGALITVPLAVNPNIGLWWVPIIPLSIGIIALLLAIAAHIMGRISGIEPLEIYILSQVYRGKIKSFEEIIDLIIKSEKKPS